MLLAQVIALALFLAFMVAAVVLLIQGLRGRLLPIDPCCARCRQRTGSAEFHQSGRCPECGAPLRGSDDIRYFRRRPRVLLIVLGLLAGLLALALPMAYAVVGSPRGPTRNASSTVAELAGDLRRTGPGAFVSLQELERRTLAGELTDADLRSIVAAFVEGCGASEQNWLPNEAASLLLAAEQRKLLSAEDMAAIGGSLFERPELHLPATIRRGARIQPQALGVAIYGSLARRVRLGEVKAGDHVLPLRTFDDTPIDRLSDGQEGLGLIVFDAPPGRYRLSAVFETLYAIQPPNGGGMPSAWPYRATVPAGADIEIVPEDAPPFVPMVTDAAIAAEVAKACAASCIAVAPGPDGKDCIVSADIDLMPVEGWTLSFSVFVVIGDQEIGVAPMRVTKLLGGISKTSSMAYARCPCPPTGPSTGSIVFRPDPRGVETDPDVSRIWGEEVVVRDVPVIRLGATAAAGGRP